ncbi:hypothetical protein MMC10_009228 [Thelotrema lepadinum]|nr:hypothetical protein [Thelotrema lepadinum]
MQPFEVEFRVAGQDTDSDSDEEEGALGTLDVGREVIKGSIDYNKVYDYNGNPRRERQGRLHNYLDQTDHRASQSEPGHIKFMPRLTGMWEDDEDDEDIDQLYTFPTVDEARSEARRRSENILRDWRLLANIIERHEATIRKRWSQKTREKRKEILLGAWPDMPLNHRPDFEDFKSAERNSHNRNRDAYLWPYMNVQDLTNPRLFPLFLNSRGRNEPDAFVEADYVACRFGIPCKAIKLAKLDNHVMRFAGRQTPETYGEICSKLCEGSPEVCEWEQAEDNIVTGAGLIILEVQERIYPFLVRCCRLILHDIPDNVLADSTVAIQPEPELALQSENTLPPLATIASEAPYRLQSELDLRRLQSVVEAKLSAAEDHLWALREDPYYFTSSFWEEANHSYQLVGKSIMLDVDDNWIRCFRDLGQQNYHAGQFARNVVCESLRATEIWRDLNQQLKKVVRLRERCGSTRITGRNIGREFAAAVMKLEHDLEMYLTEPVNRLQDGFFSSPPMRQILPENYLDFQMVAMSIGPSADVVNDMPTKEHFWIITSLCDEEQRKLTGLGLLADELGQLLESSATARNCISPLMARVISDLSVLAQCAMFVQKFYPQAVSFRKNKVDYRSFCPDFYERMKGWVSIYAEPEWMHGPIGDLADPSDGKFTHPVGEPETPENIEVTRKAERNLDALWKEIDKEFVNAKATPICLKNLLARRVLQRTPKPRVRISPQQEQELLRSLSEVDFERQQRTERTIVQDKPTTGSKSKSKTKGTARPVKAEPQPENLPVRQGEISRDLFPVDQRALKVFRSLFYVPKATGQPGEVTWTAFLHAMTSIGFAAQKLYGSVWQFSSEKVEIERPIQFHEPHPSGKLSYYLLRQIGRRLTRAYGWLGENFVPLKK